MNVYIDQMVDFKNRFFRFGGSMALFLKLLGDDELMKFVVEAANQKADANPFEQTVEEQLAALRAQNEASNWGITEDVLSWLADTAPAWPKGKDAFRSLRIRWGEGTKGVYLTFERHWEAMQRVHAKHWRWELLHSKPMSYDGKDVEWLRLLNGNETHHAVVEWVIINDLSANRKRKDITSVRNAQSLADEGLVLAWLFPKRVDAIDYDKNCSWYCAGYEANVPEHDGEEWQSVVVVNRYTDSGGVHLSALLRGNGGPGCSVPPRVVILGT
ncbi:MAG: hypothetical protein WC776_04985 [Patescibacteria group bacterium]